MLAASMPARIRRLGNVVAQWVSVVARAASAARYGGLFATDDSRRRPHLFRKGRHMSRTTLSLDAARRWIGLVAVASLAAATVPAFAQTEQDQLVREAQTTFSN